MLMPPRGAAAPTRVAFAGFVAQFLSRQRQGELGNFPKNNRFRVEAPCVSARMVIAHCSYYMSSKTPRWK
jgi:hypothetical protein